ncbi:phosphatase PAP2 family protein [Rubrivirga sp.]|uniref:phosphatase PAP2 family protein n=1 Tax=Rubrivirga sp. TaxID=1885344 RepID=UPI003B529D16
MGPSSDHPALRFLRRRLARGVPYGLGFTVAFVAVVVALWGFLELVDAVTETGDVVRFDAVAHGWVYDTFGGNPDLGRAVTWFGNNATLIGFVVAVALGLVVTRRYWAALRVVAASGLGGLVVVGLKALFQRARPTEQIIEATGYSFPSGHAFASTVFYGMMVYLVWRLTERRWARVLAAVLGPVVVLAVGLSRVYLNVHYLSDVLAGWLSGAAWLVACLLVIDVVETRYRSGAEVREDAARPPDAEPQPHGTPMETAGR